MPIVKPTTATIPAIMSAGGASAPSTVPAADVISGTTVLSSACRVSVNAVVALVSFHWNSKYIHSGRQYPVDEKYNCPGYYSRSEPCGKCSS
jgi:hypothetical protein